MKAVAEGGKKKVCERIAGKGAEGSMRAMSGKRLLPCNGFPVGTLESVGGVV